MEISNGFGVNSQVNAAKDAEEKRKAEEARKKAEEDAKKAAEEAAKKAAEEAAKKAEEAEAKKTKEKSKLDEINVLDLLLEEPDVATEQATNNSNVSNAKETEETKDVQKTEDVDATSSTSETKEIERLTEEEAIAQGYTVIKSAEDLKLLNNNLDGDFILMGDVDLSDVDWAPVGSVDKPFTGKFNGNGYSISNLTLNVDNGTATENVGFFASTSDATISNVLLDNVTVNTPATYNKGAVGTLIGVAADTNIDNVTVRNSSVQGHQKTGGLIGSITTNGSATNTKITNVNIDCDVNSAYYSGGLVGYVETLGNSSLVIENSVVNGNVSASKKAAGGFIGEGGESIVTINKCNSNANVSAVDGAERIGGFIGNANGTKIAICNSSYTGALTAQGDFQGEWYGHYMNDSHVSIFELSAGLPVDDILMIDGVESLTPIYNDVTGQFEYETSVSTLTGLDKVVAMIKENPDLADIITFNVMFDFEAMDGMYTPSEYAQYGVVQHQYEDEEGNVVNDVYIDNELDPYSTFHAPIQVASGGCSSCNCLGMGQIYEETMVEGLYKDQQGRYYVLTAFGMKPTSLAFFFENQKTNVETRLDEDEVNYRDKMTSMVKGYMAEMRNAMKSFYNFNGNESELIIGEPEYEYLKGKVAGGEQLTDLENLQYAYYELDMQIGDMVSDTLNNPGCGMGGNSSFLEATDAKPMYDENGNMRFKSLDGTELRQVTGEDGTSRYVDLNGDAYLGNPDEIYALRGYPKTDDDGRFLYTDEAGKSVYGAKNMNGEYSYTYEDGTAFEGDETTLNQQLDEIDVSSDYSNLEVQMQALLEEYKSKYSV